MAVACASGRIFMGWLERMDFPVHKIIPRLQRRTSATCVAWHPNNSILAATYSNGACKVYYTWLKAIDSQKPPSTLPNKQFGTLLGKFRCTGWGKYCAWTPSGNYLAFTGHDSCFYIATLMTNPKEISMQLQYVLPGKHLPLRCITFVSEDVAICAGDDNIPFMFSNSYWWKLAQQQVLVILMLASRDTTGNPRHPEVSFWKLPRDVLLIIIGYVVCLTVTQSGKEEMLLN